MIIVDFSQVMISSISAAYNTFKDDLTEGMIRHIFLNSIREYRKKYSKEFGNDVIIACDGKGYWRKSYFPYYKIKRASNRAESPLDWEFVYKCMDNLYNEIDVYFPYKVVKVDGAEGDDIISVLVNHFNNNKLTEKILIVSSDKDFLQLQLYPNVKQYSPMKKGLITESDILYARYEKILKGDTGDGIVNVFSDDDCIALSKRQVPATKKKLDPLLDHLMTHNKLPDDTDYQIKVNYERNKTLIDLYELQLPAELKQTIIESYNSANVAPRSEILKYLQKYQLPNLLQDINAF